MKIKHAYIVSAVIIVVVSTGILVPWFLLKKPLVYQYGIEKAFPNLTFSNPVGIYDPEDGTDRLFVVEQAGDIQVFENNRSVTGYTTFLDWSSEVSTGGERGLLGLAFHPNYTSNGYFYIYYTDEASGDSVISRLSVNSTDINLGNKTSEVEILRVSQPYDNHNGGQIVFGPDDYLYIALGDGGSANDPDGHGQNRTTLLGSILRIDVDSGSPYSIPTDNPFYGNTDGYAEEIYAFGFRNPWRMSFDENTGNLWAADVGQSSWEEIDIVVNGSNYGWKTREGAHDAHPGTNVTEMVDPIYEYDHSLGNSITGGFVYRGDDLPGLVGKYIYGDYGSGRIWSLEYSGGSVIQNSLIIDTTLSIPSFGIDSNNELYVCSFDGYIYQLNYIETTE